MTGIRLGLNNDLSKMFSPHISNCAGLKYKFWISDKQGEHIHTYRIQPRKKGTSLTILKHHKIIRFVSTPYPTCKRPFLKYPFPVSPPMKNCDSLTHHFVIVFSQGQPMAWTVYAFFGWGFRAQLLKADHMTVCVACSTHCSFSTFVYKWRSIILKPLSDEWT